MDRFALCLQFTLTREGGFSDDVRDAGGATQSGVTLATYRGWLEDPAATVADLRAISSAELSALYSASFWHPPRCQDLPPGVDLMVFDHGVTAGVRRTAMLLQGAVGVVADGWIGPATLDAARAASVLGLLGRLGRAQEAYYRGLASFPAFGRGWLARLRLREAAALSAIQAGVHTIQA